MQGFAGFPEGSLRQVPLPEPFFSDLLPLIDHLGELKVTLYALWRLSQGSGRYRFLTRDDFLADEVLLRGLAAPGPRQVDALDEALERAEARGTLLHVALEDNRAVRSLYFMNTPLGREAVERLTQGAWRPEGSEPQAVVTLSQVRSSLFTLYEQNVGLLTPFIAEELRELQAEYPQAWIEDAIRVAVRNNARSLKYMRAVLKRMQKDGRPEAPPPPSADPAAADLRRYDGYRPFVENPDESQS